MGFDVSIEEGKGTATITLSGELDAAAASQFKDAIEKVVPSKPDKLVLRMEALEFMASAGLRVLIFTRQKMGSVALYVVGAHGPVLNTLKMSGFHQSLFLQDTYAPE